MTKLRIERCEYPWIVTLNRERSITHSWRTAMLNWLLEHVDRRAFRIDDEMNTTIILRFREQGDAMLFKIRYEGTA